MTAAMIALHRALPAQDQEPLPPRQITERAAAEAGVELGPNEETHQNVTLAAHFAYGAAAGALYGAVARATPLPRAVEGMLYGMAVWSGSYLGMLPGVGLYRSATDDSAPRNALMIAAHLIWGASLGVMTGALIDRESNQVGSAL